MCKKYEVQSQALVYFQTPWCLNIQKILYVLLFLANSWNAKSLLEGVYGEISTWHISWLIKQSKHTTFKCQRPISAASSSYCCKQGIAVLAHSLDRKLMFPVKHFLLSFLDFFALPHPAANIWLQAVTPADEKWHSCNFSFWRLIQRWLLASRQHTALLNVSV